MENSSKFIQLSKKDNVLIVSMEIQKGELLYWDGVEYIFDKTIALGHKIATKTINPGEKIIKANTPIGSAIQKIHKGEHIHLHNMKSDFIPTYTHQNKKT